MNKKELKEKIETLETNIEVLEVKMNRIGEKVNELKNENEKRWQVLKDYLGVEEQECAELVIDTEQCSGYEVFIHGINYPQKAVKKTKLVKKRKK